MNHNRCLTVAAVSFTIISIELTWTRIFSAEYWYTFAFLFLSLAVLGIGLGALAVRLFTCLNKESLTGPILALTGIAALTGPPLVFVLNLDMSQLFSSPAMMLRFFGILIILNTTYFLGGIALALAFKHGVSALPRLYMIDLVAAATAVPCIIVAMNLFSTPVATMLVALPVLAASLRICKGRTRILPLTGLIAMVALSFNAEALLQLEREERAPVLMSHWDASAKIKVYDYGPDHWGFQIDNAAHSPIYGFDGNWDDPDRAPFQFGIDVSTLINAQPDCCFLSLGAGGGSDVLQALQAGATEVHAVEIIPEVNAMMLEGEICEYTGRIYHDPRVVVATEDARAYVRRFTRKFDVIYSLSSNTFAALTSGGFALAENYLFTTEAFTDYWNALSDDGYLMMEHQFYMPRLLSQMIEGLQQAGVETPSAHFAIYNLPSMRRKMLLLSKKPLTHDVIYTTFGEITPDVSEHIHLLYPLPEDAEPNLYSKIVAKGWRELQTDLPIDLSPATDDRPYIAQMGLLKNLSFDRMKKILPYEVNGFPLAKTLILMIIGMVLIIVVPLNLIPYITRGPRLGLNPFIYFSAIGMAFMAVEVVLMQKYALYIGGSLQSITAVLLTLLLASGIGSRVARRFSPVIVFGAIIILLLLEAFVYDGVRTLLVDLPMIGRTCVAIIMLAPLGFFMGMPFPKGGLRVGELIDWSFAVNGAASVLGSAGILLVAFNYGFTTALIAGALCYLTAFVTTFFQWRTT